MNYRHQHITHHKVKIKPAPRNPRKPKFKLVLNTLKITLPEVKNKAGQVIRKAMAYLKPVTVQVLHKRTA